MKILVVHTGGTIGSKNISGKVDVDPSEENNIVSLYQQKYGNDISFDAVSPYTELSENLTPSWWKKIYDGLIKADLSDYDGVIITHGTDTLAYTSAMIGLAFEGIGVPIVITAANKALNEEGSNGLKNFSDSVRLIADKKVKGTYVVYADNNGVGKAYISTRLVESYCYTNEFSSADGRPFALFMQDKIEYLGKEDEILAPKEKTPDFSDNILMIKPYPGLNYNQFDLSKIRPDAVLHLLYHSFTACVKGNSAVEFAKKCINSGIDFYIAPVGSDLDRMYSTTEQLIHAGAVPLGMMSHNAAYTKLCIAYGGENPREYMAKNISREIID